jgi:SAM-dependent methyltransferase
METSAEDARHWSDVAAQWIAWARAPNHDAFWAYHDALRAFIGPGTGKALDVGCGEGRLSRELKTLGYRMTACDAVADLVAAAREANSADDYAVAPVTRLPFADASFDRVFAYNLLMDVADVPAAVREIRRVLRPDGELMVSVVHPFSDRGRFDGDAPDAPFVVSGSYFGVERFEGVEERDGLSMHFAGWSLPFEHYATALADAGLAITAIREPQPSTAPEFARMGRWSRLPLFLWLKARPLA